jgi:MarR family transcriptional regulator, organic hydroperoxide resistance regulator
MKPTDFDHLKLENQLCFPFYAASHLIVRAYQEDLNRLGITYPQYLVLMVLWEKDPRSVNEIAEMLILNTNTVTPLLKRMEALKLIQRKSSKNDLRKVEVSLTDTGKQLQLEANTIPANLLNKLHVSPTDGQIQELTDLRYRLKEFIQVLSKLQ